MHVFTGWLPPFIRKITSICGASPWNWKPSGLVKFHKYTDICTRKSRCTIEQTQIEKCDRNCWNEKELFRNGKYNCLRGIQREPYQRNILQHSPRIIASMLTREIKQNIVRQLF